uniref:Metalloendopeptidase n=1 Tax=Cyprinodon variegatus TaxID=28743 RepID=A0A3Q2DKB9_CYPVA
TLEKRKTNLLLLLLLGLSQAFPVEEEGPQEEETQEGEDTVDLTTRILSANNGSEEMLLGGDILVPKDRNAMKCWYNSCQWGKASNGYVVIPYVIGREFTSYERGTIEGAMRAFSAYNFQKQDTNNLNTPYDYSSIMHYGRYAFAVASGRETITPIPNPNVQIGQRQGMSSWDIRRINLLYRC